MPLPLSSPPTGMALKLVVPYRTPSLNQTKRQHWAAQFKEKKKAFAALASALQATASAPSTPIILRDLLKTSSTALDTHISSPATNRGASSSKRSKSASVALSKSGPK